MNLNTLVNYKHSLFQVTPVDTTGVEIVKSKCFGHTWYAIRDGKVLCVLDTTVANDSWVLHRTLLGERKTHRVERDMWAEETL